MMMLVIVEDEDMEVSLPAMDLHECPSHINTFGLHFPSKKTHAMCKTTVQEHQNLTNWQGCLHCYSEAVQVILGLYITVKL